MTLKTEAAVVAAACAACCAPLVVVAAAAVPPVLVAGAAATAVGAGVAGLVRRRDRDKDQHAASPEPAGEAGLSGHDPA